MMRRNRLVRGGALTTLLALSAGCDSATHDCADENSSDGEAGAVDAPPAETGASEDDSPQGEEGESPDNTDGDSSADEEQGSDEMGASSSEEDENSGNDRQEEDSSESNGDSDDDSNGGDSAGSDDSGENDDGAGEENPNGEPGEKDEQEGEDEFCQDQALTVALTSDCYEGNSIGSESAGNRFCQREFGENWFWVSFHETGQWSVNAKFKEGAWYTGERAWVWIADQDAECFSSPERELVPGQVERYGMTWQPLEASSDSCVKATCNNGEGLEDPEFHPHAEQCNPYVGDTPCSYCRPILCGIWGDE